MGYLSFLILNYFMGICSSQLLQPRRLVERILALHDNSNRLVAREDSMSLYVDISEANKYPSRDDLHMRVFNKDRNVTVCDKRMAEFVHLDKFPCNFAASKAELQHGVNRFEFEVYSILDGKRFASQQIPDIHLFDHYLYEGYYDNFYTEDHLQSYAGKTLLATLFAVLLAHAIDAGPNTVKMELDRLIMHQIKLPLVAISMAVADISKALLSGTSRFFQFFGDIFIKLISIMGGGLIAYLNALLHFTGMDSYFNMKTVTDFAYLMNLVESSFRSNLMIIAQSFQSFLEIFYAGVCSPFHMIGKLLEEGLIYFLLFFSTLQKRVTFQYTFSSTAAGAPPPSKKKSQTVTLKRNTNPAPKPVILERETKIEERFPVKTIILSRGINPSSKRSALSASNSKIVKNDRFRPRFKLRNILRTCGLCIALLALTPSSKTKLGLLNFEKTKVFFQNVRSIDVHQRLKRSRIRIRSFLIRIYENSFNRSKGTSVLPESDEDGVGILTGRTYMKISEGCPYLKGSRNVL